MSGRKVISSIPASVIWFFIVIVGIGVIVGIVKPTKAAVVLVHHVAVNHQVARVHEVVPAAVEVNQLVVVHVVPTAVNHLVDVVVASV